MIARFRDLGIDPKKHPLFRSLYIAQLSARLGERTAALVTSQAQVSGHVSRETIKWAGKGAPGFSKTRGGGAYSFPIVPPRPPSSPKDGVKGASIVIEYRNDRSKPFHWDAFVDNETGTDWEKCFVKLSLTKPTKTVKGWGSTNGFKMCSSDGRGWQFWITKDVKSGTKRSCGGGILIGDGAKPARVFIKRVC